MDNLSLSKDFDSLPQYFPHISIHNSISIAIDKEIKSSSNCSWCSPGLGYRPFNFFSLYALDK